MKRCEHCRYPLADEASECPNCKQPVRAAATKSRPPTASSPSGKQLVKAKSGEQYRSTTLPPPAQGGCILPVISTFLLIIAGAVIGGLLTWR